MDNAALRQLLDKEAIRQQILNYSRALDRIDEELGKAVFHPEATADYGAEIFRGTAWDFVDWCLAGHRRIVSHSHQMGNISIWLDGDRARSETYGDVTVRMAREDGLYDIRNLVRYIDAWERRDDAWRIASRICVHDMDHTYPVAGTSFEITGRRDRTDPSYFPAP